MIPQKVDLCGRGYDLVRQFCKINDVPTPQLTMVPASNWHVKFCAYWREDRIYICLPKCAHPGKAARAWSWPGYVIDRTPYGVVCHEFGHHIDSYMSDERGAYYGDFSVKLRKETKEPPITSYAPDDAEWFAEIFRLFITNPDLLQKLRPATFKKLHGKFETVEPRSYKQVLRTAPERTRAACEKKIKEASRRTLL